MRLFRLSTVTSWRGAFGPPVVDGHPGASRPSPTGAWSGMSCEFRSKHPRPRTAILSGAPAFKVHRDVDGLFTQRPQIRS